METGSAPAVGLVLRKRETTVTPEANDIGEALKSLVVDAVAAGKDGKVDAAEIAALATKNFQKLMVALQGGEKSVAEFAANPYAAARGLVDPILEALEESFKK